MSDLRVMIESWLDQGEAQLHEPEAVDLPGRRDAVVAVPRPLPLTAVLARARSIRRRRAVRAAIAAAAATAVVAGLTGVLVAAAGPRRSAPPAGTGTATRSPGRTAAQGTAVRYPGGVEVTWPLPAAASVWVKDGPEPADGSASLSLALLPELVAAVPGTRAIDSVGGDNVAPSALVQDGGAAAATGTGSLVPTLGVQLTRGGAYASSYGLDPCGTWPDPAHGLGTAPGVQSSGPGTTPPTCTVVRSDGRTTVRGEVRVKGPSDTVSYWQRSVFTVRSDGTAVLVFSAVPRRSLAAGGAPRDWDLLTRLALTLSWPTEPEPGPTSFPPQATGEPATAARVQYPNGAAVTWPAPASGYAWTWSHDGFLGVTPGGRAVRDWLAGAVPGGQPLAGSDDPSSATADRGVAVMVSMQRIAAYQAQVSVAEGGRQGSISVQASRGGMLGNPSGPLDPCGRWPQPQAGLARWSDTGNTQGGTCSVVRSGGRSYVEWERRYPTASPSAARVDRAVFTVRADGTAVRVSASNVMAGAAPSSWLAAAPDWALLVQLAGQLPYPADPEVPAPPG